MTKRLANYYENYKKKEMNGNIKVKKYTILFTIMFSIILIVCIFSSNKNNDYAMEKEVYFVVAGADIDNNNQKNIIKNIEEYGGSGVLSDLNEYKNCAIIFVYSNKNDAEKILERSKTMFLEAKIISIKSIKLSKNLQNKIKNNNLENFIEFIFSEKNNLTNFLFDYEKGDISFNELYNQVYAFSEKLKEYQNAVQNYEKLLTSVQKLLTIANNFLNSSIIGEYSTFGLKKLCVNLFIEEIHIKNQLKIMFS